MHISQREYLAFLLICKWWYLPSTKASLNWSFSHICEGCFAKIKSIFWSLFRLYCLIFVNKELKFTKKNWFSCNFCLSNNSKEKYIKTPALFSVYDRILVSIVSTVSWYSWHQFFIQFRRRKYSVINLVIYLLGNFIESQAHAIMLNFFCRERLILSSRRQKVASWIKGF